ncbi:MAG: hypothetical protein GY752_11115 [bacterium]|nr:hypothetical protein [bacterium]MCP4798473.1 hypothetical protein [bacterium]
MRIKQGNQSSLLAPKGVFVLLFYLIASFGVPTDLISEITHLIITGESLPPCNCVDESCCCGAPCCAPEKEAAPVLSCCDLPGQETAKQLPEAKVVFSKPCVCGSGQHNDVVASSFDSHFPIVISSIYIPELNSFSGGSRPSGLPPYIDPPDHIPICLSA